MIIPIKFDPFARLGPYATFSKDSKYLLISNIMSPKEVDDFILYVLDPDLILERMNTMPDSNGLVLKPENQ